MIQFDERIFQLGWFNPPTRNSPWTPFNHETMKVEKSLEIWVKYQVIRLKMRVFTWLPMEFGPTDLQAAMKEAIKLAGPGKPYDMKVPRMSFPPKKGPLLCCLGCICQG